MNFWKRAFERAAKTAAQTLLALTGGNYAFDIRGLDAPKALAIAAGATLISLLTSIASAEFGPDDDPSLV